MLTEELKSKFESQSKLLANRLSVEKEILAEGGWETFRANSRRLEGRVQLMKELDEDGDVSGQQLQPE